MPLQGLLRRNRKSDTDIRQNDGPQTTVSGPRYSEHLPRNQPSTSNDSSIPDPHIVSNDVDAQKDAQEPISAKTTDSVDGASSSQPSLASAPHHTSTHGSLLKSRNASDSQLSAKARQQAEKGTAAPPVPKMPAAPAIITTAPTMETVEPASKRKSRLKLPNLLKTPSNEPTSPGVPSQRTSFSERRKQRPSGNGPSAEGGPKPSRVTFDESGRQSIMGQNAPPPYGEHAGSALALPISRLSESSRSDGSLGDQVAYATTTTTHTVSTTTTFFRLPRRKKNKSPLFPLPSRPSDSTIEQGDTPRSSTGARSEANSTPGRSSPSRVNHGLPSPLPSPSHVALAASSMNFAAPGTAPVLRKHSTASTRSSRSTPSLVPPAQLARRGRSSTAGSTNRDSDDVPLPTPPLPSGRNSTSTAGRNSLGGIFSLSHRLRNNSEPPIPHRGSPGTPGSSNSKPASFNLHRESIVVPERQTEDTPARYLVRLEEAVSRSVIASVLSKHSDTFSLNVLRSYMRSFAFFEDPMDMAIRKLLMEVELPKETQQIDRVLQGFADRYHECNPGIYASSDQAYFIAFSLLILHTDVFNKNNKHKMQKQDYLKNTHGEGISGDILECFYDNISYTPFIHVEDELDINGERILTNKPRKVKVPKAAVDPLKKSQREPVDPYTLIIDRKLDVLRPTLKHVVNLDDSYNYLGTVTSLDMSNLHKTFFKSAVLQIVSARSRPDAFMSPSTITNPEEAHPGVVDIKITKVGLLWRKEAKRKRTRSPWQEWGAILTGSQLFLFRNTAWVKSLIHQHDSHHKQGLSGIPVIFKPPVEDFKPETLMSTQDAVALLDSSYRKHKNAFLFVRHGGLEETFLADNENEMNDWLAKLNYAAAFRTSGVRMRGVVGGNYEGQRSRGIRRMDSSQSGTSVQSPTGEVSIVSGKIDTQLAQQISVARRQIMTEKIEEADVKLAEATREMDALLRNARHLQVLAPIQAKTREQVVFAAGRMAAQLRWKRIDIWRRKCHRDVLALDLEEETKTSSEVQLRNRALSGGGRSPLPSASGNQNLAVTRLDTRKSTSPSAQRVPRSPSSARPTTKSSTKEKDYGMEEIFSSPSEVSLQGSRTKAQAPWELPPLSLNPQVAKRESLSSVSRKSPRPESLTHQSSNLSAGTRAREASISESLRLTSRTPTLEEDEGEMFREAGYVDPDALALVQQQSDAGSEPEEQLSQSKDMKPRPEGHDKHKVRRSLHRTLRDAHVPTHHRSKKGKDSASTVGVGDDALSTNESEGLARSTGSFTVHGKKASVINFGSEWHNMSPEERLRLRKQAHSEDSNLLTPLAVEDEQALAQKLSAMHRRPSATSASTGTSPLATTPPASSFEPPPTTQQADSHAAQGIQECGQPSQEPAKPAEEIIPGEAAGSAASSPAASLENESQKSTSDEEFQDAPAISA